MGWDQARYIASQALEEQTTKIVAPVSEEDIKLAIARALPAIHLSTSYLFVVNSQLASIRWTVYAIALLLIYIGYRLTQ